MGVYGRNMYLRYSFVASVLYPSSRYVVIIMLVVWVCVRWLVVCRVSAVIVIIDAMIVAVSIGLRGVWCLHGFLWYSS